MSKKSTLAFLVAALLASAAIPTVATAPGIAATEEAAPAKAPAPPAIRVVAAVERDIVEKLAVSGTVVAREEANAGTDLNGMIVNQLNADQGDRVTKGQVLAVLDRSALDTQMAENEASRIQAEANIAQTESQIADAEVAVRQANEGLGRATALHKKGFATQADLDNAVNAKDSATAKLETAKRALQWSKSQIAIIEAQEKSIQIQLDKTEVKAPCDGLVLSRNATVGGIVSSSGGPLFRLALKSEFELAADIAETALPKLAQGMPSEISVAGWDAPVAGKIRLIAPEVNQTSRLGMIRISLASDPMPRVGNFGRAEIETLHRRGIAVPASAVIYADGKSFLQKVVEGRVSTVPVKLGVRAEGYVEVLSGIVAGDEVVARAGTFVADGDMVTPVRGEETGALRP
jgi:HlyD family secretion protein